MPNPWLGRDSFFVQSLLTFEGGNVKNKNVAKEGHTLFLITRSDATAIYFTFELWSGRRIVNGGSNLQSRRAGVGKSEMIDSALFPQWRITHPQVRITEMAGRRRQLIYLGF